MPVANPARRRCVHHDQAPRCTWVFLPRGVKRRELSAQRRWISRIGADLNQLLSSAGKPGQEIHLQIHLRSHIGDIGGLPLQFVENDQFECVAGIPES